METLTEQNLSYFLEKYHNLHDGFIDNINFFVKDAKIEFFIKAFRNNWEKVQLKIIFNNVKQYKIKDLFSWDYIYCVEIKFVKLNDKVYISFKNDKENVFIDILCEKINIEEI